MEVLRSACGRLATPRLHHRARQRSQESLIFMLDPLSSSPDLPHPSRPSHPTRKLLQLSPTHPDDYILELDFSSLDLFNICARRAENQLVHSRQSTRTSSAPAFGNLYHRCEELRLREGLTSAVISRQHEMVSEHFLHSPCPPGDHRTAERMIQVLRAYNERYAMDGWSTKVYKDEEGVLFVERPFKVALCTIPVNTSLLFDPLLLCASSNRHFVGLPVRNLHVFWTGRIDAILSEPPFLWVVDHKTTSSGGREFEEAFRLSAQTVGYTWAAQKLIGKECNGLIVNEVLIRAPYVKQGPKSGGLAREEFNRLTFFYSQDRLLEWEESTKHIVSDFVSCLVRGYFPMSGPRSFKSPCLYCDFAENCSLPRSQRSADLASDLYQDVTWNPMHDND